MSEPKEAAIAKTDSKKQPPQPKEHAGLKEPKEQARTKEAVAEPADTKPAAAGSGKCPSGMRFLAGGEDGFCMDRFEYPGQGKIPSQGIGLTAARASCKARGQRLCTAKEWLRACGGAFPYGQAYDAAACNTGHGRVVASGSKKTCRSRAGVFDLSGNVSEWVEEGVAMGGDAKAEQAQARCSARSSDGPMTGFRCCADPELE